MGHGYYDKPDVYGSKKTDRPCIKKEDGITAVNETEKESLLLDFKMEVSKYLKDKEEANTKKREWWRTDQGFTT